MEIKIKNIKNPNGKREKKVQFSQEGKKSRKKRYTQLGNENIFADCKLARYARDVEQRYEQKDKQT